MPELNNNVPNLSPKQEEEAQKLLLNLQSLKQQQADIESQLAQLQNSASKNTVVDKFQGLVETYRSEVAEVGGELPINVEMNIQKIQDFIQAETTSSADAQKIFTALNIPNPSKKELLNSDAFTVDSLIGENKKVIPADLEKPKPDDIIASVQVSTSSNIANMDGILPKNKEISPKEKSEQIEKNLKVLNDLIEDKENGEIVFVGAATKNNIDLGTFGIKNLISSSPDKVLNFTFYGSAYEYRPKNETPATLKKPEDIQSYIDNKENSLTAEIQVVFNSINNSEDVLEEKNEKLKNLLSIINNPEFSEVSKKWELKRMLPENEQEGITVAAKEVMDEFKTYCEAQEEEYIIEEGYTSPEELEILSTDKSLQEHFDYLTESSGKYPYQFGQNGPITTVEYVGPKSLFDTLPEREGYEKSSEFKEGVAYDPGIPVNVDNVELSLDDIQKGAADYFNNSNNVKKSVFFTLGDEVVYYTYKDETEPQNTYTKQTTEDALALLKQEIDRLEKRPDSEIGILESSVLLMDKMKNKIRDIKNETLGASTSFINKTADSLASKHKIVQNPFNFIGGVFENPKVQDALKFLKDLPKNTLQEVLAPITKVVIAPITKATLRAPWGASLVGGAGFVGAYEGLKNGGQTSYEVKGILGLVKRMPIAVGNTVASIVQGARENAYEEGVTQFTNKKLFKKYGLEEAEFKQIAEGFVLSLRKEKMPTIFTNKYTSRFYMNRVAHEKTIQLLELLSDGSGKKLGPSNPDKNKAYEGASARTGNILSDIVAPDGNMVISIRKLLEEHTFLLKMPLATKFFEAQTKPLRKHIEAQANSGNQ